MQKLNAKTQGRKENYFSQGLIFASLRLCVETTFARQELKDLIRQSPPVNAFQARTITAAPRGGAPEEEDSILPPRQAGSGQTHLSDAEMQRLN
jgi:hypothetical protein